MGVWRASRPGLPDGVRFLDHEKSCGMTIGGSAIEKEDRVRHVLAGGLDGLQTLVALTSFVALVACGSVDITIQDGTTIPATARPTTIAGDATAPPSTDTSRGTTPSPLPVPTPTPVPTATTFDLVLPFKVSREYDPVTRSLGEVSFAGEWILIPFGGTFWQGTIENWNAGNNPDIVFEVVPETVLTASISGRVRVDLNPVTTTPEGDVYDPKDWEVHIEIANTPYFLGYDHVVELQVVDGQFANVGDSIGRASPAAIRHSGPSGLLPIDEFEWSLKRALSTGAEGKCPLEFMSESEIAKLQKILTTMANKDSRLATQAAWQTECPANCGGE